MLVIGTVLINVVPKPSGPGLILAAAIKAEGVLYYASHKSYQAICQPRDHRRILTMSSGSRTD